MMQPSTLIVETRALLAEDGLDLPAAWSAMCVFLLRQAIEITLSRLYGPHEQSLRRVPTTRKLIMLQGFTSTHGVAREAAHTWHALSAASHLRGTGAVPSRAELELWCDRTDTLINDLGHLEL